MRLVIFIIEVFGHYIMIRYQLQNKSSSDRKYIIFENISCEYICIYSIYGITNVTEFNVQQISLQYFRSFDYIQIRDNALTSGTLCAYDISGYDFTSFSLYLRLQFTSTNLIIGYQRLFDSTDLISRCESIKFAKYSVNYPKTS